MPTIAIVEPHTLYRLGMIRLLADTLPSAKLLEMDYPSLETETEQQPCELLLLSVPSAEATRTLLKTAERIFNPEAVLLLAETACAFPSSFDSSEIVKGHLVKNVSPELMVASINLVLAGGTCFTYPATPPLQDMTTEEFNSLVIKPYQPTRWPPEEKALGVPQENEAELLGITPRQYEVLVLLARGMTIKGVARELNISAATAKVHAESLYMRMNVNNRNEAVYQAVAKGARLGIPTWVA